MKKKTYRVIPSKKQLAVMKLYWKMLQMEDNIFWAKVAELEKKMSKKTGIKDLEFFKCDGDYCGIGNSDRTMELIQMEYLE